MKTTILLLLALLLFAGCSSSPEFVYVNDPVGYCDIAEELLIGHNTTEFTPEDWNNYAIDVTEVYLARAAE